MDSKIRRARKAGGRLDSIPKSTPLHRNTENYPMEKVETAVLTPRENGGRVMPTVFQTGEREGRPLFPDRLYYTSAQKVADILQIPVPRPCFTWPQKTALRMLTSLPQTTDWLALK